MLKNFLALLHATTPAPGKPAPIAPYIVRDAITHNIIASGSRAACEAYIQAFGHCYLETVQ